MRQPEMGLTFQASQMGGNASNTYINGRQDMAGHIRTLGMSAFQNILACHVPLNLWVEIIGLERCCWKGNHFQGLRVGCCLTLGNELS